MATAAVTYTFTANTLVKASEANTNLQNLVDFLNQQVIHKDGSVAFTAHASGPATDPSSANQYSRKAYVDSRLKVSTYNTAPSLALGANGTGTINLYSAPYTISGAGVVLVTGTIHLEFSGSTEQEFTATPNGFSSLHGQAPQARAAGTSFFKVEVPFMGTKTVADAESFVPKLDVALGNSPTSATVVAVEVIYIKVPSVGNGL